MAVRYTHTYECDSCGTVFQKKSRSPNPPDPACPNLACPGPYFKRASVAAAAIVEPDPLDATPNRFDYASDRAPAQVGSTVARAVDETARIVMEDHGLTDLRDNIQPGEMAAPKLPPKLQEAADGFFGSGKRGNRPTLQGVNTARLAKRALSGAYRPTGLASPDPVQLLHDAKVKPPVRIIAGDK